MTKLIYTVGNFFSYTSIFLEEDWEETNEMSEADLILFCGGEDVSPELYLQYPHPTTYFNRDRDSEEVAEYNRAKELGIPCVGICRGGQFLNVMNGGKLYQDVDNHAIGGTHPAKIMGDMLIIEVTSTHHQMMAPNYDRDDCIVLMTAKESTRRSGMTEMGSPKNEIDMHITDNKWEDVESVVYTNTMDLCFQPHPEYDGAFYCREAFFFFIDNYLFSDVE